MYWYRPDTLNIYIYNTLSTYNTCTYIALYCVKHTRTIYIYINMYIGCNTSILVKCLKPTSNDFFLNIYIYIYKQKRKPIQKELKPIQTSIRKKQNKSKKKNTTQSKPKLEKTQPTQQKTSNTKNKKKQTIYLFLLFFLAFFFVFFLLCFRYFFSLFFFRIFFFVFSFSQVTWWPGPSKM